MEIHPPLVRSEKTPPKNEELASEIADRWVRQLRAMSWPDRIDSLADLFEHLQDSLGGLSYAGDIFPIIVAEILHKLGDPNIDCLEQAHIYASSKDRSHREAAGDWFRHHR